MARVPWGPRWRCFQATKIAPDIPAVLVSKSVGDDMIRALRPNSGQQKSGTIFRVGFSLISLGGQAPHVLRAHMWALNTCGEPSEIELTVTKGVLNGPGAVSKPVLQLFEDDLQTSYVIVDKSSNIFRAGVFFLISFGSPHARRAKRIELTATHG